MAVAAVVVVVVVVACVGVIVDACYRLRPTSPTGPQSSLKHPLTDFDHF